MSKSGMLLFVLLLLLPLAIPELAPAGRSVTHHFRDFGAKRSVPISCVNPSTPNLQGSWQDKKCCSTKLCSPTNCCESSTCSCVEGSCQCL
uniref:Conopeptide im027 n=2 Tax=Conus TaxID=6490 RepID=A0A125S9G1_CONIM|nr:conopeptide im027 [Conus imperialis]